MKYPFKKIKLSPYPFDVLVFYWTPIEELKQWIQEEIPEQVVANPGAYKFDWEGRTIITDWGWIILWVKNKATDPITYGYLVHEIFHCVEFLYNRVWLEYSIETGEWWAYMIQYILTKILDKK